MIKRALCLLAFLGLAACGAGSGQCALMSCGVAQIDITVFAAASLQPAFDKIAAQLPPHLHVTFSYAGTQTLTSQLTQGAQADVFASADTAHMTAVQNAGLLDGQPKVFVHNRLEIAVEHGNPKGIHTLADLTKPGLAVVLADPSVPAGKYAQQALTKAGVTVHPASLEPQVTGVLSKVELGEADAGIVYVSDVTTSGRVDGIAIPESQNVVADYVIATLKSAQSKSGADVFIRYVLSPPGQAILAAAGFEKA